MPERFWKCPKIDMKHEGYIVKCVKEEVTNLLLTWVLFFTFTIVSSYCKSLSFFCYKGGNPIICELSHFQFLTGVFPLIHKFDGYEVHL
jgi:hypothetical protein